MVMGAGDFVLRTQIFDELRKMFCVSGWEEGSVAIALAVVFDQVREALLKEREEHRCRTRFQEKRIGEDVIGAGLGSGADDRFEVSGRIGNPREDGRTADADTQAGVAQRPNGIKAEIRTRGAGFEDSCQIGVESRDRDVNGHFIGLSYFSQQVEIADDEIGLGDDAEFEAAMTGEFFKNAAGDFVAALRGLVGIGSGPARWLHRA